MPVAPAPWLTAEKLTAEKPTAGKSNSAYGNASCGIPRDLSKISRHLSGQARRERLFRHRRERNPVQFGDSHPVSRRQIRRSHFPGLDVPHGDAKPVIDDPMAKFGQLRAFESRE